MYSRFYRAADSTKDIEPGKGTPIPIVAATAGRKQDGIDLADLEWNFERGKPVDGGRHCFPLLYGHNFTGDTYGVVHVGVGRDGTSLDDSYVIFDPEDEQAVRYERKFLSPVSGLNSFSISWETLDGEGMPSRSTGKDAVANQLLEVSLVPVPMDWKAGARDVQDARAELVARSVDAINALARDLTEALGDEPVAEAGAIGNGTKGELVPGDLQRLRDAMMGAPPVEAIDLSADGEPNRWRFNGEPVAVIEDDNDADAADEGLGRDAAAEMVAVFAQGTDDSDEDRRRTYRALLPAYRRLGWTAPEFVERAELDALDGETWRGLFLHDEPDMLRVGKVLSRKNMADLTEAMRLIRGVLAAAGDGSEGDAGDGDAGRAIAQTEPPMAQDDDAAEFARILTALMENPSNG